MEQTASSLVDNWPDDEPEPDEPEVPEIERHLADFTEAVEAMEAFRGEHHELLAQLEFLQERVNDGEATLKEVARRLGGVENYRFAVSIQQKARRWYDVDKLLVRLPWLRQIPGVVVETVDRAKVEDLIKKGSVPALEAQAVLHVDPLTPAVTIKRK